MTSAVKMSTRGPLPVYILALLVVLGTAVIREQAHAQNGTLEGQVSQNETGPFVDIIEAGKNLSAVADRTGKIFCDWMQGACDMLHALVAGGGRQTDDCLQPLETGVEYEREEQALVGPQSAQLDQAKNALEQQRDQEVAKVPPDCFYANPRPDYPILRKVRPRPTKIPDYTRPDGSFGPKVGGLVSNTGKCVQDCRDRLTKSELDCAARTTGAHGVTNETMADYESCIQPAIAAFYVEYRQCFPAQNPPQEQPSPPPNTADKPFACQAYWNDWHTRRVGACGNDRACIDNANAVAERGLAGCGKVQPPGPITPSGNEGPFVKGFGDGVGRCVGGMITDPKTIATIAALWGAKKVKQLENYLRIAGLVMRGGSVIEIASLVDDPPAEALPSADPYQIGLYEGKRFCEWEVAWNGATLPDGQKKPGSGTAGEQPPRPNPIAGSVATRKDCFWCTIAWLLDQPYLPPPEGGVPLHMEQEIQPILQREWGGLTPQGPPTPWWQQEAQAKGLPTSMTPAAMGSQMRAAGDGAKALVFMVDVKGEIAHIFGLKTVGNGPNAKVISWDNQLQMDGTTLLSKYPNALLSIFRIQ